MPETGPTVTVMTVNVGAGLADDAAIVAAVRAEAPDIVAFQELPRRQAHRLRAALADCYPATAFFGDGHEGRGVLSRYPIHAAWMVEIATGRPDCLAEVEVAGQVLTVVVAHPRPQRITRAGLIFDFASLRQVLRLARITQAAAPAVMLGDLNMSPRHPGYLRIRALGLVDAYAEKGAGRGLTFPTRVGSGRWSAARIARRRVPPVVRFDYIWCTPDVTVLEAWVGRDAGSDHAPVLARLVLPAAEAPPLPPPR